MLHFHCNRFMSIRIRSVLMLAILPAAIYASPSYSLSQNLSIGSRVFESTFLSDDTLVTAEQDGEITFFEFNGSQFNQVAAFANQALAFYVVGSDEEPRQVVSGDFSPKNYYRYEHRGGQFQFGEQLVTPALGSIIHSLMTPDGDYFFITDVTNGVHAFKFDGSTYSHFQTVAAGDSPRRFAINEDHTLAVVGRGSGLGSTLYSFDGVAFAQLDQVAESGFYKDLIFSGGLVIGGSDSQELRIYAIENHAFVMLQTIALSAPVHKVSLNEGPGAERILIVMLASEVKYFQHQNGLFKEAYALAIAGFYASAAVSKYSRFIAFTNSAANTYVGIYFNTNYTDPVGPTSATTPSATPTSVTVNTEFSTVEVEEDIAGIESAIAKAKNSVDTLEIMIIGAVVVLGLAALGGILTLILRASHFERLPSTEEPRLAANGQGLMKPANQSKNELAENDERGNGNGGGRNHVEIQSIDS